MRRTMGTTMAVLTCAAALQAQEPTERRTFTPPPEPPAAQPRIGYAGTPTPPATAAPVQVTQPTVYYYLPGYYSAPGYYSPGGYITTGAPYVVLNDGSVLVNFGNGYERVLRPCASPLGSAPADPYARDALGRIPEPPGIAALRAGTRGQLGGNMPARNASACYRVDARGRPEVVGS